MSHFEAAFGPPLVEFLTPKAGSFVASGLSTPEKPSPQGQEFIITIRVTERELTPRVKEGSSFSPGSLPGPNPSFPALVFTFDSDFITPAGSVLSAGTNLAALFQFAGSEMTRGGAVAITFIWFVGGSIPQNVARLTMTAAITDEAGFESLGKQSLTVGVLPGISGDMLTENP